MVKHAEMTTSHQIQTGLAHLRASDLIMRRLIDTIGPFPFVAALVAAQQRQGDAEPPGNLVAGGAVDGQVVNGELAVDVGVATITADKQQ